MPIILVMFRRWAAVAAVRLFSWRVLIPIWLLHYFLNWYIYAIFEEGLSDPVTWWYFYCVTITTVGYGDISPASTVGRLFFPELAYIGIMLLTAVPVKIGMEVYRFLSRKRRGLVETKASDHIVLLFGGQSATFVTQMAREIIADTNRTHGAVIIGSDNPDHAAVLEDAQFAGNGFEFKYAPELHHDDMFLRTGIDRAEKIVVRGSDDNEIVMTILAINVRNRDAHIVAMLHDRSNERHVRNIVRNPPVECIVPLQDLITIQEMQDPGLAALLEVRLSNGGDSTFYRIDVPEDVNERRLGDLLPLLWRHGVLITALKVGGAIISDPREEHVVQGGDALFVSAKERPKAFDWTTL